MILPKLTLVLGGARSGKSGFAESLAARSGLPKTYVATAQALDDEMAGRIARHRDDRGNDWQTIEATLWLSNRMLAGLATDGLPAALADCPNPVICVANEVGMGLVPETSLGRDFRDAQGRLNQAVAAQADLVVFIAAGLPIALKGRLP